MPKSALIIRNVSAISIEEVNIALEGLESHPLAPQEFNQLLNKALSKEERLDLFKNQLVRDYIYNTVKEKTGNHIIYHLNGIDEGKTYEANVKYILDKLTQLPSNQEFDLMYLGGGHGDPEIGSSNLSPIQLSNIATKLQEKKTQFSAVVFGSCFSAAYLDLYQPVLKEKGVMLGNSLECGEPNNFRQVIQWLNSDSNDFYSEEDFPSQTLSPEELREVRSTIKRLLDGTTANDPNIKDNYTILMKYYSRLAESENPDKNTLNEQSQNLYLSDLNRLIAILVEKKGYLTVETFKTLLANDHLLSIYIEDISQNYNQTIYNELLNSFEPGTSSMVLIENANVTLQDFTKSTKPPNAASDYWDNYVAIVNTLQNSKKFAGINQVTDLNIVSAKRKFNDMFKQAVFAANVKPIVAPENVSNTLGDEQIPALPDENNPEPIIGNPLNLIPEEPILTPPKILSSSQTETQQDFIPVEPTLLNPDILDPPLDDEKIENKPQPKVPTVETNENPTSPTQPQTVHNNYNRTFIDMIDKIKGNIKTKQNGRWTKAVSGDKIDKLDALRKWVADEKNTIDDNNISTVIDLFQAITETKRHSLNFFSNTPHSVEELTGLIKHNNLNAFMPKQENRHFIPKNIHHIKTDDDVNHLLKSPELKKGLGKSS